MSHCGCGSKRARCEAVWTRSTLDAIVVERPSAHRGGTRSTCVWTKGMPILQALMAAAGHGYREHFRRFGVGVAGRTLATGGIWR